FFLAMVHWHLGDKDQARSWFDRAVAWMDKNQPPNDEELRLYREEAEALLDRSKAPPRTQKPFPPRHGKEPIALDHELLAKEGATDTEMCLLGSIVSLLPHPDLDVGEPGIGLIMLADHPG